MRQLTWEQACAIRLRRHFLTSSAPSLKVAASQMCGVHAQVMSAAALSLALRTEGTVSTDVETALWSDRLLTKTFGLRGTVHLFPTEELGLWMTALASAPYGKRTGMLDALQTDTVIEAIGSALDGRELTIDELSAEVITRAGAWAGEEVMPAFNGMWPRWRSAMGEAAYRGALRFGPARGRKVTYTKPLPWKPFNGDALAEVALRYLRSYGPATPAHFARWMAIAKPGADAVFAALGDRLEEVSLEGSRAWLARGADASPVDGGLRLLGLFDAYTVGCHPRELFFPGQAARRALSGGQAGNVAVIVIDGTVAGIWHQRKAARKLTLTVEPFVKLKRAHRRQLGEQAERIGEIVGATPSLTIGEVTARAHL
jgi:hypothetical protein